MVIPTKKEIIVIAVILLGAAAECYDLLPPKYGGVLLAVWTLVRMYLRTTGQSQLITESKDLANEITTDISIMGAKRAEAIIVNHDSKP